DIGALEAAMGPRTKIVLVNTPNNPTGRIYPASDLAALASAMERRGAALGRTIYLVSDEPYRALVFDGATVASPLASYPHSILVTSYSKELSLPGERIGYVAVNPRAEDSGDIMGALSLANRILGFVNAPSLMQHVIAALPWPTLVDVSIYQSARDLLASGLKEAGYEFNMPEGAFYLFPRIPGNAGDQAFLDLLKAENILVVPGSAFGKPGYFRIAFCVDQAVIKGALPGFARALARSR
ncbi:MAG TPA: pyridoxal phosphate-dependent aminotransferase, partial [Spirochaetaceae bacterium]|nr:pyridoxal phosphate-dependent aminotransferase [Spirochaetaceae bacterium]